MSVLGELLDKELGQQKQTPSLGGLVDRELSQSQDFVGPPDPPSKLGVLLDSELAGDTKAVQQTKVAASAWPVNGPAQQGVMTAPIPDGTGNITSVRKEVQAPPITAATPYSFPRFKPQSKLWEQTKKSWQRGGQAVNVDFMWSKVARGEIDEAQAVAAEKEYSELIKNDPIKAKNWLENLYLKTVQMARPMGEGALKGAKYGTAAAATAAVAGQAGPQVALPEELVTMPSAYAIGQTAGSVKYWAEQGHGLIYREARKQGLTHETAAAAAAVGGPLYAYIEYSQVDKIIPGMQKLKGKLLQKAIQIGLDTVKEVGEEGVQRVVTDGSVLIGQLVEGQIGASDVPGEVKQMAINALDEMKEAAGPMALLQLPRAGLAFGGGIITEKEQKAPVSPIEARTPEAQPDRTQEAPIEQPTAQPLAEDANVKAVAEKFGISEDKAKAILDAQDKRQAEQKEQKEQKELSSSAEQQAEQKVAVTTPTKSKELTFKVPPPAKPVAKPDKAASLKALSEQELKDTIDDTKDPELQRLAQMEMESRPKPAVAPTEKQPWEMTSSEYVKSKSFKGLPRKYEYHRPEVQLALKQGKPVPAEVLAEYPDLAKPAEKGKVEEIPTERRLTGQQQENTEYPERIYYHGISGSRLAEFQKTGKIPQAQQAFGGNYSITDDYDIAKGHAGEKGIVLEVKIDENTDVDIHDPFGDEEATGSISDSGESEFIVWDSDKIQVTSKTVVTGKGSQVLPSVEDENLPAGFLERNELIDQPPQAKAEATKVEKKATEKPPAKRVISKDAFEKAKKRLTDRNKLSIGVDPQGMADLFTVGAYHFENGVRTFAAWSKKMVESLGDWVEPHLEAAWPLVQSMFTEGKTAKEVTEQIPAKSIAKANTASEVDTAAKELLEETSARQADIAEDREALGLEAMPSTERKAWQVSLQNAKDQKIPDKALRLATEINISARALNDEETAGLVIRASELKVEHRKAIRKIKDTTDPADIMMQSAEIGRIESEFNALTRALHVSGTEKGRALVSQKLTIDRDFDLISVKARAKAAKGKELSAKESAKFAELTEELDKATERIDDMQRQIDELNAGRFVKKGGLKQFGRMTLQQKNLRLDGIKNRMSVLLEKGCY